MQNENDSRGPSNTPAERTDRKNAYRVLLDWVGMTFFSSLGAVLEVFETTLSIGVDEWRPGRKNYEGYAESYQYENINIYYGGLDTQGIHVDITGQGCRKIDELLSLLRVQNPENGCCYWYELLKVFRTNGAKFTRIDTAIDDFSETFTVPYIFMKLLKGEVTSRFRGWQPYGNFDMDGDPKEGLTIYWGSEESRLQAVMYEKGKQLGLENFKWTRTELKFRHERAENFVDTVLMQYDNDVQMDLGYICGGILRNMIQFRDKPDNNDQNKRRWPVSPFWDEFLGNVEPLKIAASMPDRSIERMKHWMNGQVSKTVAILYHAFLNLDHSWLKEILENGQKKLTPADIELINKFRQAYEQENVIKLDVPNVYDMNKKNTTAVTVAL